MKQISAGIIVKFNDFGILMVHPTRGKKSKGCWDISKGKIESGETPLDAALREFKEETNLDLADKYKDQLVEIGKLPYKKDKDLYLFVLDLKDCDRTFVNVQLTNASCPSTFMLDDKELPENDDYLISPNLKWLFPRMEKSVLLAFDKYNEIKK